MSKCKSASERPIDAKFTSLLREAEKAETEEQIEQVLSRVADLKKCVVGKKRQHNDSRPKDPLSNDGRLFAECERVIGERLKKMRKNIRTADLSKESNLTEHRSHSKGRDNSKTLPNKKCHSQMVEAEQQLHSQCEAANRRTEKLESRLDRSLQTIQKQQEQINQLRNKLQSRDAQYLEKLLGQTKLDPDKTVDHRSPQRADLWERDVNLNDSGSLMKEKQRIIDRYEERISQKNQLINELKHEIIVLQTEMNGLRQQSKLEMGRMAKEKQDLKKVVDTLTERFESSIREKDELRRLNQEYRQQTVVMQQEIQRLAAEKALLKDAVNRDYSLLKEEFHRRDNRQEVARKSPQPAFAQERLDRYLLLDRIQQSESELQKLRRDLQQGQMQNRELKLELTQSKEKLEEFEQKYSEKKMKYGDLKRELERVKSETMLRTAQDRSLVEEELKRTPASDESSKNIERRIRALQGIKSMIRRFPR